MDYFKSINAHVQGEMDIDAVCIPNQQPMLISLGGDTVTWRDISNTHSDSIQLPPDNGFNKIALHPSGRNFLLGGSQKQVYSFPLSKQKPQLLYESMGSINDIKYSSSGRYILIASEQPKAIVLDTINNRNLKCRPGHKNKIYNAFFNKSDRYIVSIGQDCFVLIYELFADKDPQEVFRTQFTNQLVPAGVNGCFHESNGEYHIYVPGTKSLQVIEYLNNRWQIKSTNMGHSQPIVLVSILNQYSLITSSQKDLCTWSILNQQKLIVLENMSMCKIIPISNTFISHRHDGIIYVYDRPFYQPTNRDLGQDNQSHIQVEEMGESEAQQRDNIELQYDQQNQEQDDVEEREHERKMKKKFAQRLVKVLPQSLLSRATDYFQDSRFLFTNIYGYIIQTRQNDESSIFLQLSTPTKSSTPKLLLRNKDAKYFDINNYIVCYASQSYFGLIIDKFTTWEKDWINIQAIAISSNWLAVANFQQIRFVDFCGNLIKCVCFDRPIICMQAYQNLLAVVYHDSIPMYESQMLAMKIFTVNQFQGVDQLPECIVPLSISDKERGCTLSWFGFSSEGMIFSQDSFGAIRAYSLQTNQWTPVILQALPATRKAWIVGFQKGQALYWRTTQSQPQPTVRPRLNIKTSRLQLPTFAEQPEQLKQLPNILWQRYVLDHQLARHRLWNIHKQTRKQKHINYNLSKTILSLPQIEQEHKKLDTQLLSSIQYFMKNQMIFKAVQFVKSYIRCNSVGRDVIQILDQCNHRGQAVELQYYYDEKDKDTEYETMQMLALKQLRTKAQTSLRSKKQNPLNPKFKKPQGQQVPYSFPSSQPSQSSSIMQDITQKSQQNSKIISQENSFEMENPFLKKKATSDRKQQIQDHIEKYGVKRKVEDKKKSSKTMF